MEQKTAQQKAEERIPWDQATTDAVGLSCDAVHNTRDIARAAYATAIVELVEPRDRLLQEAVDGIGSILQAEEVDAFTWDCECEEEHGITCGTCATFTHLSDILAKAKEQFGIEPSNQK